MSALRSGLALGALPVLLASCVVGAGSQSADVTSTGPPAKETIETVSMDVTMEGAIDLAVDSETRVRTTTLLDDRLPDVTAFGVNSVGWIRADDGQEVQISFGISPFHGADEYRIPSSTAPEVGGSLSSAGIAVRTPAGETQVFQTLEKPCVVRVGPQGSSGSLRCPALSGVGGRVSVIVSWDAIPDPNGD